MFSELVHCMLIVVIALAKDRDQKGVEVDEIAREHNIPVPLIRTAAKRLLQEELVSTTEEGLLLLTERVSQLTLCDLVFRFGDTEFNGIFKDPQTKAPLRLCMASRVIIQEQNKLYGIVENRLQHMNLLEWSRRAGRTICI